MQALPIEISYWRWDLSKQEKMEILEPLIRLLDSKLLEGPTRAPISVTLAVLERPSRSPSRQSGDIAVNRGRLALC
jgi:hypothetical protein